MKVLVTGSGGLIGSECCRLLCQREWEVIGLDNDMRAAYFGIDGSTRRQIISLKAQFRNYKHAELDIRDRDSISELLRREKPHFIIHTAAQPSHDRASEIPYDDFDVNAVGTFNLLVAARDSCIDSPVCFMSTNKVYGDRPNKLPLQELETRYDFVDLPHGINEQLGVDQCLHSLFGASKVAADIVCQEFARTYDMPVGVFRAGCITGPNHAAVEQHGYLAYIIMCAVRNLPYTIYGYSGKQVRDQLHCRDLASLLLHFFYKPHCGSVYNVGGGRSNSISVLETVTLLNDMGLSLDYTYDPRNRKGDHICYITDLTKIYSDYPSWTVKTSLNEIVCEIVDAIQAQAHQTDVVMSGA
jgi:CDP-paratose 2-epimerase